MADDDILSRYYGEPPQPGADEVYSTPDVMRRMRPPPGPLSRALQGTASALDAFAEGPEGVPNKAHLVPFLARAGAQGARSIDNWTQGRPQVQDMLAPTGGALLGTAPIGSLAAGAARRAAERPVGPFQAYHGTDRPLEGGKFIEGGPHGGNFADNQDVPQKGVWFGSTPDRAAYFALSAAERKAEQGHPGTGPNIIPAQLDFQNPYVHSPRKWVNSGYEGLPSLDSLRAQGYDGVVIPRATYASDSMPNSLREHPTHRQQELEMQLQDIERQFRDLGVNRGSLWNKNLYDPREPLHPHHDTLSALEDQAQVIQAEQQQIRNARYAEAKAAAEKAPERPRIVTEGYDYAALKPGTVKSATTGETLFADNARASVPGTVVGGLEQAHPLREAYASPVGAARIENPIRVRHGSPQSNIKEFSDQWPTFVSESPAHAEMYRAGASDRGGAMPPGWHYANSALKWGPEEGMPAIRMIEEQKLRHLGHVSTADELNWILDQYGGARGVLAAGGGRGNVYDLNMHTPRERILDWDKPLSQQSPHVRDALRESGLEPSLTSPDFEGWTAKNQKALRDANIPAVAYKEGDQNYMITDPRVIEIMKQYGVAAPVAAGMLEQVYGQRRED